MRASMASSYDARSLGNWEIPPPGHTRSLHDMGDFGGRLSNASGRQSMASTRRSSGGRTNKGLEWRASVANRSKSIVDANGHLLPHKKKQNSTFRYSLDPSQLKRRLHPAAMSQGLWLTQAAIDQVAVLEPKLQYGDTERRFTRETGSPSRRASRASRATGMPSYGKKSLPPLGGTNRPTSADSLFGADNWSPWDNGTLDGPNSRSTPNVMLAPVGRQSSRRLTSSRGRAAHTTPLLRSPGGQAVCDRTVYVCELADHIDHNMCMDAMRTFGPVVTAYLRATGHNDHSTKQSWALVVFEDASAARAAVRSGGVKALGTFFAVKALDLRRALADHNKSEASKHALTSVWRKLLLKSTVEGHNLEILSEKLQQRVGHSHVDVRRFFTKELRSRSYGQDQDGGAQTSTVDQNDLQACCDLFGMGLSNQQVQCLFADLDCKNEGAIDLDTFRDIVVGLRHGALDDSGWGTATGGNVGGQHEARRSLISQQRPRTGDKHYVAAEERSVWIGKIPAAVAHEDMIRSAFAGLGEVDTVHLRIKTEEGKTSWGFLAFKDKGSASAALAAGMAPIRDPSTGTTHTVSIRPLQMQRAVQAGHEGMSGEVWRQTIADTSHGKSLELLRDKIKERTRGGANSVLRLFKVFRNSSRSDDNLIDVEQFKHGCKMLGMPSSERQLETLFKDLDALNQGTINIDDFRVLILGRNADLKQSSHTKSTHDNQVYTIG